MFSKIQLLDCTLRDGGYINNFNFGKKTIRRIFRKLNAAKLDIVEVGFLSDMAKDEEHTLYPSAEKVGEILSPTNECNSLVAAMIALGEKEISYDKICPSKDSVVDIIRITFHNEETEIGRAFEYARNLMGKGYLVCMQPVGTTAYTDIELISLIEKINTLSPFAFYLVDTLGVLSKQDLLHFLYIIDHNLNKNIKIGLHSHNNLQMSFANVQEIMEFPSPREFIIDSSVFGMGRGAGNLCTEIISDFINNTVEEKYDTLPMLEIIDESLMSIFAVTPWGYSAAYFLSASKKCHPNYSSYLLSKQTLPVAEIGKILDCIPQEERHLFNSKLIDRLYLAHQEKFVDDTASREALSREIGKNGVLLIAPGKSVTTQQDKINEFIQRETPYVISVNFMPEDIRCDRTFITNQKRFNNMTVENHERVVFTSNVRNRPESSPVINYTSLLNEKKYVYDNAGLMLMKLLLSFGIKKIYLAGFDGFVVNQIDNYANPAQLGVTEQEHNIEINKGMTAQLAEFRQKAEIEFVTDSIYR